MHHDLHHMEPQALWAEVNIPLNKLHIKEGHLLLTSDHAGDHHQDQLPGLIDVVYVTVPFLPLRAKLSVLRSVVKIFPHTGIIGDHKIDNTTTDRCPNANGYHQPGNRVGDPHHEVAPFHQYVIDRSRES